MLLAVLLVACGDGNGSNNSDSDSEETTRPTSTPVVADTVEVRVTVREALIFDQPTRDSSEVYRLLEGDVVEAAGRSEEDILGTTWFVVSIGDLSGWVAETQVELVTGAVDELLVIPNDAFRLSPVQETQIAESQQQATEGAVQSFAVIARATADNAPVYENPRLDSDVTQQLNSDDELEVVTYTQVDDDGIQWYGVRILETLNWVSSNDFDVIGDLSIRPEFPLETTNAEATATPQTPTVVADEATEDVLPTPSPDDLSASAQDVAADSSGTTSVPTLIPTMMPDAPDVAALPTATPTATLFTTTTPLPTATPRSIRPAEPPLITIELPDGWDEAHVYVPLESTIFEDTDIILSLYEGPLSNDATGQILILWRFPLLAPQDSEVSLWSNAVLYPRSLLYTGCVVGGIDTSSDFRRTYTIGNLVGLAQGSPFSVISCQDGAPDVAGWFAYLTVENENYIFYNTVQPASEINNVKDELQSIVDTIRFLPAQ